MGCGVTVTTICAGAGVCVGRGAPLVGAVVVAMMGAGVGVTGAGTDGIEHAEARAAATVSTKKITVVEVNRRMSACLCDRACRQPCATGRGNLRNDAASAAIAVRESGVLSWVSIARTLGPVKPIADCLPCQRSAPLPLM